MTEAPMIRLSGAALVGVEPDICPPDPVDGGVEVCLGAILGPPAEGVPMLGEFMRPKARTLPAATNRRAKATTSLARMYANDRMGCCVISGKAHKVGLLSANDGPLELMASDAEIITAYNKLKAGPGDVGCYIDHVLDHMRDTGIVLGGVPQKIDGYVGINAGNKDLARAAIQHFGSFTIGFALPEAWTNSAVWDVTTSRIVGGHDVEMIDYDEQGLFVSSWGRIYLMTWAAYLDRRWVSERYVSLSRHWYNDDKLSPGGVDVAKLRKALDELKQGDLPDIEEEDDDDNDDHQTIPLTVNLTGAARALGINFPITLTGTASEEPSGHAPKPVSVAADAPSGEWLDKLIQLILMFLEMLQRAKAEQDGATGGADSKGGDVGGEGERQREGAQRPVDRPGGDAGDLGASFDRRTRGRDAGTGGSPGAAVADSGHVGDSGGTGGVARAETRGRRGRPTA